MKSFRGKTAIVTGGGSGIGKELAKRLVRKFGDDTLRIIEKEQQLQKKTGVLW